MSTTAALVACGLLLTTSAFAQLKGNPENWCRDGAFPRESKDYRIARIKGAAGEKVHFHNDLDARCPADPNCRSKAYVIPNDEVIVSRTFGKFACSGIQPRKGYFTVGWLDTDRLTWLNSKRPSEERDWLGDWRASGNSIRISKAKAPGEFAITGDASWGTGSRAHTGELDHTAKPSADRMKFGDGTNEYDCQVEMQLVGKYLVVADNQHCGGANVSFSGVYQKRSTR